MRTQAGPRGPQSVWQRDVRLLRWGKRREVRFERCLRRSLAGLLVAVALMVNTPVLAQDEKPNILFVLMDNLGYGELGVYGGGELRAPRPPASINSPPKERGSPTSTSRRNALRAARRS